MVARGFDAGLALATATLFGRAAPLGVEPIQLGNGAGKADSSATFAFALEDGEGVNLAFRCEESSCEAKFEVSIHELDQLATLVDAQHRRRRIAELQVWTEPREPSGTVSVQWVEGDGSTSGHATLDVDADAFVLSQGDHRLAFTRLPYQDEENTGALIPTLNFEVEARWGRGASFCSADTDCASGRRCFGGVCGQNCLLDVDCPVAAASCVAALRVSPTSRNNRLCVAPCTSDDDCAFGEACYVNGACVPWM